MTWVLQLTKQAVDVCDWINGVGTRGIGWTCCCPCWAPAVELPTTRSRMQTG